MFLFVKNIFHSLLKINERARIAQVGKDVNALRRDGRRFVSAYMRRERKRGSLKSDRELADAGFRAYTASSGGSESRIRHSPGAGKSGRATVIRGGH